MCVSSAFIDDVFELNYSEDLHKKCCRVALFNLALYEDISMIIHNIYYTKTTLKSSGL